MRHSKIESVQIMIIVVGSGQASFLEFLYFSFSSWWQVRALVKERRRGSDDVVERGGVQEGLAAGLPSSSSSYEKKI